MSYITLKINLDKYVENCHAILVIDKMDRGVPAKGGIRILPNLKEEDVTELAHEMSVKSLIASLPFGGAKGGIILEDMEMIPKAMYGFGRELAKLDFVPEKWNAGPDLNVDCQAIDAFVAGVSSVIGWRKARLGATGKSSGAKHEMGSTAYGIIIGMDKFVKDMNLHLNIDQASFLVEGIGQVGGTAIRAFLKRGNIICGMSDSTGAIYQEGGLPSYTILKILDENKKIKEVADQLPDAEFMTNPKELQGRKADVLLLASPGKTMDTDSVEKLQVNLIIEGANSAYANHEAELAVFEKGIYSIPGVLINSGGFIGSYEEWRLEQENMMYLKEQEMWDKIKHSVETRIIAGMTRFCEMMKTNPKKEPHELVHEMYDELERLEGKRNTQLRISTKNINYQIENLITHYDSDH